MTQERVRQLIATTFRVPSEQVPGNARMSELARWDSLGHLELMLAVEMEFKVRIPARTMLELQSVESIVNFLDRQQRSLQ